MEKVSSNSSHIFNPFLDKVMKQGCPNAVCMRTPQAQMDPPISQGADVFPHPRNVVHSCFCFCFVFLLDLLFSFTQKEDPFYVLSQKKHTFPHFFLPPNFYNFVL